MAQNISRIWLSNNPLFILVSLFQTTIWAWVHLRVDLMFNQYVFAQTIGKTHCFFYFTLILNKSFIFCHLIGNGLKTNLKSWLPFIHFILNSYFISIMALKVGHAIASGIFDLKDTEEPFHPWWETAQDYICYCIILIGNIYSTYFNLKSKITLHCCSLIYA